MKKTGIKSRIMIFMTTLFMLFSLVMPVYSTETAMPIETDNGTEITQTIETKNTNTQSSVKPQKEVKNVLGKFLHVMLLVGGSALLIFLVLLMYKKSTASKQQTKRNIEIKKDLYSPETIAEATKFFIEKF